MWWCVMDVAYRKRPSVKWHSPRYWRWKLYRCNDRPAPLTASGSAWPGDGGTDPPLHDTPNSAGLRPLIQFISRKPNNSINSSINRIWFKDNETWQRCCKILEIWQRNSAGLRGSYWHEGNMATLLQDAWQLLALSDCYLNEKETWQRCCTPFYLECCIKCKLWPV